MFKQGNQASKNRNFAVIRLFFNSKPLTTKESILKRKTFLSFIFILMTVIHVYSNEASTSVNSFDDKLFGPLCNQSENVNYSALSIYSLLYALLQGSNDQTHEQIKDVTACTPSEAFDSQIQELITNTENMSNSVWYKKSLGFNEDYKQFMSDFDFTIKPTDFSKGPAVRKEINQFISKKTNKLIENFLSQDLPSSTRLVLLNTLYFNQKWANQFHEYDTRDEAFFKNSESAITTPMMHKSTRYNYFEDESFQMLELAYEDSRYSMIIFLPKDLNYDFTKTNPNVLMQKFDSGKRNKNIQLTFPKFDLSSRYDLVPVLQALGMTDAFNPQTANLSKIFSENSDIYVDCAIHQVKITVNEKETKAAAVTMFGLKATSARPESPIQFKANHPFCYVIRDKQLDINLFTGIIRNPR